MTYLKRLIFTIFFPWIALAAPDRNTSDLTLGEFFKTKDGQNYISIIQYKFAQEEIEATSYFNLTDAGELIVSKESNFNKIDSSAAEDFSTCNFLLPAQLDVKTTSKKIIELLEPYLKKEEVKVNQLNVISRFKNSEICTTLVQFADPDSVLIKYNEKNKTYDMILMDSVWQFDNEDASSKSKIIFSSDEITWISYNVITHYDNTDLIEVDWKQKKVKNGDEIFGGAKIEFLQAIDNLMVVGLRGHEIKIYKSGKLMKTYTATYDS